ncbi:MAG: DUF2264 domain-containing protein [Acidobacteriota bacterium]
MRSRRTFLKGALLTLTPRWPHPLAARPDLDPSPAHPATPDGAADRRTWVDIVERVSQPVLEAISQQKLRATMPVESVPGLEKDRAQSTHLEAVGRLLCGLAPWLEGTPGSNPAEEQLRTRYREWSRLAIRYGTDPQSPDALHFGTNQQSLVDAAFLALAVVRAPNELWTQLDSATKQNLLAALRETRKLQPGFNNWLLFSATIEAFFCKVGETWDPLRIDYALRELNQWYVGDGIYGDGPHFHWDYYNSFVIQPMLLNILDALGDQASRWSAMRQPILARAQRYAAIEEHLIGPDATYPPIGRSIAYRFGAFQHLAEISLRRQLPEGVSPAQVRCALTAVMTRQIAAKGTFDEHGWLTIGFAGHQPSMGEPYISTGSLYLCSAAWLPLGLPATDEFWSAPAQQWTQQKAWSGIDIQRDHAIGD